MRGMLWKATAVVLAGALVTAQSIGDGEISGRITDQTGQEATSYIADLKLASRNRIVVDREASISNSASGLFGAPR